MPDYIDRDRVIDRLSECFRFYSDYNGGFNTRGVFRAILSVVPAADVRPVVHGKWFLDGDYEYINCSECLYPFYMGFDTSSDARRYLASEERWNFCPNCGAKMDLPGEVE